MNLKEKIKLDLNSALKQRQDLTVSVLRQTLAVFLNKEKDKKSELTDQELIEIIFSEAKKRKESIKEFEKGNRQDLVDKETKELKILEEYLPEQLTEQVVKELINQAVIKTKAQTIKDMGKVMAQLMPEIKGKIDVGIVSSMVKNILTNND